MKILRVFFQVGIAAQLQDRRVRAFVDLEQGEVKPVVVPQHPRRPGSPGLRANAQHEPHRAFLVHRVSDNMGVGDIETRLVNAESRASRAALGELHFHQCGRLLAPLDHLRPELGQCRQAGHNEHETERERDEAAVSHQVVLGQRSGEFIAGYLEALVALILIRQYTWILRVW